METVWAKVGFWFSVFMVAIGIGIFGAGLILPHWGLALSGFGIAGFSFLGLKLAEKK